MALRGIRAPRRGRSRKGFGVPTPCTCVYVCVCVYCVCVCVCVYMCVCVCVCIVCIQCNVCMCTCTVCSVTDLQELINRTGHIVRVIWEGGRGHMQHSLSPPPYCHFNENVQCSS